MPSRDTQLATEGAGTAKDGSGLPHQIAAYESTTVSRAARIARSNSFAWTLSLLLHVGIFLAFYQVVFREAAQPKAHIIPEARLGAMAPSAQPQSSVPLRLAQQPTPPAEPKDAPNLDELPVAALPSDKTPSSLVPAQQSPQRSVPLASTAISHAAVTMPVSRFFGLTGNAYKVVYVVDVSASLMIYIEDIGRELRNSIRALVPTQRFHIVLAKPRQVEEFAPRRLVPAIGRYKTESLNFITQVSGIPEPGKADPIEAMRRAFAVEPQLIYFLTDGDYPDIETDLERTLQQLNPDGNVKITTIGFDPSPGPRSLLERIAREHGGHCRFMEPK